MGKVSALEVWKLTTAVDRKGQDSNPAPNVCPTLLIRSFTPS